MYPYAVKSLCMSYVQRKYRKAGFRLCFVINNLQVSPFIVMLIELKYIISLF